MDQSVRIFSSETIKIYEYCNPQNPLKELCIESDMIYSMFLQS